MHGMNSINLKLYGPTVFSYITSTVMTDNSCALWYKDSNTKYVKTVYVTYMPNDCEVTDRLMCCKISPVRHLSTIDISARML